MNRFLTQFSWRQHGTSDRRYGPRPSDTNSNWVGIPTDLQNETPMVARDGRRDGGILCHVVDSERPHAGSLGKHCAGPADNHKRNGWDQLPSLSLIAQETPPGVCEPRSPQSATYLSAPGVSFCITRGYEMRATRCGTWHDLWHNAPQCGAMESGKPRARVVEW